MPTLPRHAALPAVRTASLWLFVSERPFAVPLCSPGVWRPAQCLRLRAKCQHSCQHSHCVPRRAQGRERSERHLPPFLAVRFLFHPLPAYSQRLVAPSAHLIPLEKCSEGVLIPLEKCSAGMFIPLEKCSAGTIIPLEKCIFVPEIPENVMLKRKIEQAPHSRFLLAQREPPITKQGTYP